MADHPGLDRDKALLETQSRGRMGPGEWEESHNNRNQVSATQRNTVLIKKRCRNTHKLEFLVHLNVAAEVYTVIINVLAIMGPALRHSMSHCLGM